MYVAVTLRAAVPVGSADLPRFVREQDAHGVPQRAVIALAVTAIRRSTIRPIALRRVGA